MGQASRVPLQTILCIDDDDAILRFEKLLLERSGYTVLTASSARQGLRLVSMCECDVVLLDYEIPVMNGHEIAAEIKRVQPKVIVIFVSGCEIPIASLALVDAFVPKLETSKQLLPIIAELCGRLQGVRRKRTGRERKAQTKVCSPTRMDAAISGAKAPDHQEDDTLSPTQSPRNPPGRVTLSVQDMCRT